MKRPIDSSAECAVRQTNTNNILLWHVRHLHRLTTLIDTEIWLVTSTGQYVNICVYRLLNIYLNRS